MNVEPHWGTATRHALQCMVLVLGALPGISMGAEPAQTWLSKMVEAARTLSYDGTFIYRRGHSVDSMRIIHRWDAEGERERLISLN
ncbi:MAG: hypothetical protein HOI95_23525, partial [Chromatiales bacterium]|nr:hypothetical protein [Chromatiales bacterium]